MNQEEKKETLKTKTISQLEFQVNHEEKKGTLKTKNCLATAKMKENQKNLALIPY